MVCILLGCTLTSIIYRYESTTGVFSVSPDGDGFYYFSINLRVRGAISAGFDIEIYEELICTAYSDVTESSINDSEMASCSGVAYGVEGISEYF